MLAKEALSPLEAAYQGVYIVVLIIMAFMLFTCLVRSVKGPRMADRVVAVNMMGTMVMVIIAILSLLLKEGFLIDICLIYAMVSFLAVIVLSKVYIGIYEENRHKQMEKEQNGQEKGSGNGSIGMD